jgi:hypothetical protein
MKKIYIYLIGIVPLGFFYYELKNMLGQAMFLLCGIVYLILLRLFAEKIGK